MNFIQPSQKLMKRRIVLAYFFGSLLRLSVSTVQGQWGINYDGAGQDAGSHSGGSALAGAGQMALEKKRYDRAIEFFEAALAANPKPEMAMRIWELRGDAYIGKKEWAKARRDYQRALVTDPTTALDHIARAIIFQKLGNYQAVGVDLRKATKLAPKNVLAWGALAWLRATAPAREARDGREAVAAAAKVCALTNWRDAHGLDTMAAAQAEAGDFAAAIKYETQALGTRFLAREDREEFEKRLALYRQRKPFREARTELAGNG